MFPRLSTIHLDLHKTYSQDQPKWIRDGVSFSYVENATGVFFWTGGGTMSAASGGDETVRESECWQV